MSNLNCRWATVDEMNHIVETGLVPQLAPPKPVVAKAVVLAEGAAEEEAPPVEAPPEAEPDFSWAAMISPPRTALLGTEKVFALMGPFSIVSASATPSPSNHRPKPPSPSARPSSAI